MSAEECSIRYKVAEERKIRENKKIRADYHKRGYCHLGTESQCLLYQLYK